MPKKIVFDSKAIQLMAMMYQCGRSTRDIAKIAGCCYNAVNSAISGSVSFNKNLQISIKASGRQSPAKGAVRTHEQRKRISDAMRGRKSSHTGMKRSPESRARMSEARRRYFASLPQEERKPKSARVMSAHSIYSDRQRGRYKRLVYRLIGARSGLPKHKVLGFTKEQFLEHICALMPAGCSWEKRDSFHIDHIVPVSAFLAAGVSDPAIVNALCNLRPITPEENRAKSDKYDMANFHADLAYIMFSIGRTGKPVARGIVE